MRTPFPALSALLLAASSAPAFAQDDFELSANAGLVSDYRFRGISLTDRDPAVQGGIDLEAGPFFLGAWGSSIAEYGGADVELDLYGGLQGTIGEAAWSAGAYAYLYPGGEGVNYVELVAQGERTFGPVTFGVEAALAPRQANVAEANRFIGASSAFDAGAGWTFTVRGGYEDGFYDSKWDWEIGAAYTIGPLTASLAYVDTNHGAADEAGRLGRGGVVGSLIAEF
jgi:uncharacterized protein (TIGR02001 family)